MATDCHSPALQQDGNGRRAGLCVGDRVLRAGDTDLKGLSTTELRRAMLEGDAPHVILRVHSVDGTMRHVTVMRECVRGPAPASDRAEAGNAQDRRGAGAQ